MSSSVDDTGLQFIHGRGRRGGSSDPLTVTNPPSGDVVATDTLASVDDVHEAVAAAKAALPGWTGATPAVGMLNSGTLGICDACVPCRSCARQDVNLNLHPLPGPGAKPT